MKSLHTLEWLGKKSDGKMSHWEMSDGEISDREMSDGNVIRYCSINVVDSNIITTIVILISMNYTMYYHVFDDGLSSIKFSLDLKFGKF